MNRMILWFAGYALVEISGVELQQTFNGLAKEKIPFWDIASVDEFTACIKVLVKDLKSVETIAEQNMCAMKCIETFGFLKSYGGLRLRWALLASMSLCILLILLLPQRVWFFKVEGNAEVPADRILRSVLANGVGYGTLGKAIVPQKIKDRVLLEIPELEWLTVTQNGACATIVVREKQTQGAADDRRVPKNIIASADGIVEEITVLDGAPTVEIGQTVTKGDLLISGYIDLEYKIRATAAQGEVYARTWEEISAVTPKIYDQKCYTGATKTIRYLEIGKYRIKLSYGSGIFTTKCDKMTKRKALTLPLGLTLPIAIVKETLVNYETKEQALQCKEADALLRQEVLERKNESMIAGEILYPRVECTEQDGLYHLNGSLECREMIGRTVSANIFKDE